MSFLFRGERVDNDEVEVGNHLVRDLKHYIFFNGHASLFNWDEMGYYEVKPETVQIKFGDKWISYAEFEKLIKVTYEMEDYLTRNDQNSINHGSIFNTMLSDIVGASK